MIFNLSEEYPVIALDEARMLGWMKGAVIQDNKLTGILCYMEDDSHSCACTTPHIKISIDDVAFGPDAAVIKKSNVANVLFTHRQTIFANMGVYTLTGELAGGVTAIDADADYFITGIQTDSGYITSDRIKGIGNIILVNSPPADEDCNVAAKSYINHVETCQKECTICTCEHTFEEQMSSDECSEETDNLEAAGPSSPIESLDSELDSGIAELVHSRYGYLLGKKLIIAVTIAGKTYASNSTINTELIETSIKNNCILNLIMSAED